MGPGLEVGKGWRGKTYASSTVCGLLSGVGLAFACSASAQTTQTFDYDVQGRLTNVRTVATSGAAQSSSYQYDAAGNRISRQTMTSDPGTGPGIGPISRVIVVPLNGFTIIPIGTSLAVTSASRAPILAAPTTQEKTREID